MEASPKYSKVEVSHYDDVHECGLMASMWPKTFRPHDLVCMHGTIAGHKVCILVDDATCNFLNYKLVKRLKLPQTPCFDRYVVSTIQGDNKDVLDTRVNQVPLSVQGHLIFKS